MSSFSRFVPPPDEVRRQHIRTILEEVQEAFKTDNNERSDFYASIIKSYFVSLKNMNVTTEEMNEFSRDEEKERNLAILNVTDRNVCLADVFSYPLSTPVATRRAPGGGYGGESAGGAPIGNRKTRRRIEPEYESPRHNVNQTPGTPV